MKLKKLFVLIPLALLLLGGCAEGDSGVEKNGDTTNQSSGENGEEASTNESSKKVKLPLSYDAKDEFAEGKGWTYITNNEQYPDPGYYKTDGVITGLKLNFAGMGIASGNFDPVNALNVSLTIHKLNKNTKEVNESIVNVFEIEGYNASGEKVCMTPISKTSIQASGTFDAALSGERIASIKIMFKDYAAVGGSAYNINLSKALVSAL